MAACSHVTYMTCLHVTHSQELCVVLLDLVTMQPPTYLDGEARRQLQGDEVLEPAEVCVAGGHQVYDGEDLLGQGERVVLTQPQRRLEALGLGGLLNRTPNVTVLKVNRLVKVLLRGDVTRVVGQYV